MFDKPGGLEGFVWNGIDYCTIFPPSNRALWCRSTLVLHNYTVSFSPLSYLNWILFGAYRNCYTSIVVLCSPHSLDSAFFLLDQEQLLLCSSSLAFGTLMSSATSQWAFFSVFSSHIHYFICQHLITFKISYDSGNHEDFFSDSYFSNSNLGKWGEWDAFLCPLTL